MFDEGEWATNRGFLRNEDERELDPTARCKLWIVQLPLIQQSILAISLL
ncbi:MAG: hypothetical protein JWR61_5781 [Ferruginibacter sp.]|nr:hypothetical protein [Ferruginibacter sp.]